MLAIFKPNHSNYYHGRNIFGYQIAAASHEDAAIAKLAFGKKCFDRRTIGGGCFANGDHCMSPFHDTLQGCLVLLAIVAAASDRTIAEPVSRITSGALVCCWWFCRTMEYVTGRRIGRLVWPATTNSRRLPPILIAVRLHICGGMAN
jgi:hypothetical protein